MPKFDKYTQETVPIATSLFIAKKGSETVTYAYSDLKASFNDIDIVEYATDAVLTSASMGKLNNATAAAIFTAPEITADMVGKKIGFGKRAAGSVTINRSGSDVFKNDGGDDTSLTNTDANQTWANIWLIAEKIGVWGIYEGLGDWL